ncbi:phosphopyruvate hydratase [bacterium]|nr:phosphopyruvate hydratase [bacterium]
MKSQLSKLEALQVIDSRGNPTVAVRATLTDGAVGSASVPSGASTGQFEAIELRDTKDKAFGGKGVQQAVRNVVTEIAQTLSGADLSDQRAVDKAMLALDGTANKQRLGANAILGTSLAIAHAVAASRKMDLYEHLGGSSALTLPVPLVNVINGGAHANNSLDIQEFMIVPHGAKTFSEAMRMAAEVFKKLGSLLKDDGFETAVGDEGGYAPRLESQEQAFEYLMRAIERAGYQPGQQISLALDVASSELVKESAQGFTYKFEKSGDPKSYSAADLVELYATWATKYPIVSIEDGVSENDWDGWKTLTKHLGAKMQLVGDDLFVTNTERLRRGIEEQAANSILIKLNQIGTLTETLDAIAMASEAGFTSVISHRSGETGDTTIADLAVATNAGQIKTGSMCRGERVEKYNRLLWIEAKLGSRARYTSPF